MKNIYHRQLNRLKKFQMVNEIFDFFLLLTFDFQKSTSHFFKKSMTETKQSTKPRPPPIPIHSTTPNPPIKENDTLSNQTHSAKPTIAKLSELVQMLDITATQKDKLEDFLKCREKIGDLANEDLSVEGELGSGNGGVVLKVRHRKTGTIMAKKVTYFHFILLREIVGKHSCFFVIEIAHSLGSKASCQKSNFKRAYSFA